MNQAHATVSPSAQATAVLGELLRHLLSTSPSTAGLLISRLHEAVRTYEIDFRGFINGQGQRPPLELAAVLATAFAELAAVPDDRCELGFRLESLEARFRAAQRLLTHRLEHGDRRLPVRVARAA